MHRWEFSLTSAPRWAISRRWAPMLRKPRSCPCSSRQKWQISSSSLGWRCLCSLSPSILFFSSLSARRSLEAQATLAAFPKAQLPPRKSISVLTLPQLFSVYYRNPYPGPLPVFLLSLCMAATTTSLVIAHVHISDVLRFAGAAGAMTCSFGLPALIHGKVGLPPLFIVESQTN